MAIRPSDADVKRAQELFDRWGHTPSPATLADLAWAFARVREACAAKCEAVIARVSPDDSYDYEAGARLCLDAIREDA